jgi:ABC-2 type transport system ATP-binding protein
MNELVSIAIEGVFKQYKPKGEYRLKDVSLDIIQGDVFGLLGPNGAGKTTLISILCGLLPPSKGEVHYFENGDPISSGILKSKIGFVPQEYAFYPELTPLQNLEYFGAMYNLSSARVKARSEELLSVLGLLKVANEPVNTFSGGMKRRVNLAIGIIHQPSILFLDEPTVGVDVQSKHAIIRFLEELNKAGTTIIYTSHHLTEAAEFCNRIALIDNGRVIASDRLPALLATHKHTDLQALFIALTGEEYRD